MKAYTINNGSIKLDTIAIPSAKHDEYLIKVEAIGLNRADLLQIKGLYPSPDGSNIPGLEVSGSIESTNTKVCALLTSGGFAEYVCVKKSHTMALDNIGLLEGAAIPEALATCYLNLIKIGMLKSGEKALIHGGSSGIGSMAIQIAKHYGAYVVTSSSKPVNHSKCLELGADSVINYRDDFHQQYKNYFDLILDILGGEHLHKNMSALTKYGRLVAIAVMSGSKADLNMGQMLMKNISIYGSTLRSQTDEFKSELIASVVKELMPLVKNNTIKPVIDSVFQFSEMQDALKKLESGSHFGKVLIKL